MGRPSRKQELFIAEYLVDLNATRAALAAGYSQRTAKQQGAWLLTNVYISAAISDKLGQRLDRCDVSAVQIINELKKLAFYDPIDLLENDGGVKPLKDIPEPVRKALAGFEVTEIFDGAPGAQKRVVGILKKIKTTDRIRALELLGKYREIKAWTDSVTHSGELQVNASLTDIERAAKITAILETARRRKR